MRVAVSRYSLAGAPLPAGSIPADKSAESAHRGCELRCGSASLPPDDLCMVNPWLLGSVDANREPHGARSLFDLLGRIRAVLGDVACQPHHSFPIAFAGRGI